MTKRGTSNGNSAGSAEDRRRRRKWLLETFAADVFMVEDDLDRPRLIPISALDVYGDDAILCCRCYRCGKLLTLETLTVDRIIPGCKGGRYVRNNIRPACSKCNESTGGKLGGQASSRPVPVVRPGVSGVAPRDAQAGRKRAGAVPVPDVPAPGTSDLRRSGKVA